MIRKYKTKDTARRALKMLRGKYPHVEPYDWLICLHPFDSFYYAIAYNRVGARVYMGK
jgi:hypothetical protein